MTDREKLIEILRYGMDKYFLLKFEAEIFADLLIYNGVTFAKDMNVPSELSGNSGQFKWISVEDRLPEDDVQVLACTKHGKAFSAHCEKGKWQVSHSVKITHWMPLPEAPKES